MQHEKNVYIMKHSNGSVKNVCGSEEERKTNSAWANFAKVTFILGFEE